MSIDALRTKTPRQVRDAVNGFARRYVEDWNHWLNVEDEQRWPLFGTILRKWQATRPKRMRRLQREAPLHSPPYLDDLIRQAQPQLDVVRHLTITAIGVRTAAEDDALRALWTVFEALPVDGTASSVGITKAVLLLTDGRIGPAFDSRVRRNLGVPQLSSPDEWLRLLGEISDDVLSFEAKHRRLLREIVPDEFARLEYGRLYDMALGPRMNSTRWLSRAVR